MSGYPFFIPGFVLCTNSSLFWFKIANKLSEFRNYLFILKIILEVQTNQKLVITISISAIKELYSSLDII